MHRRTFIVQAATLPLATSILISCPALSQEQPATPPVVKTVQDLTGPDWRRYRLTRDRVLNGTGPQYTPDFLLEDCHTDRRVDDNAFPAKVLEDAVGDVIGIGDDVVDTLHGAELPGANPSRE